MYNKLLGIALCFILLATSVVAQIYCEDNQYYHQYLNEVNITNCSEDILEEEWNKVIISDDDYHLNEYFFMNLAGDLIKNSPLIRYTYLDNELVLLYQKPEKAVNEYSKYQICIYPKTEQENVLNTEIVSFVDYNYLTTNKRICFVPYLKDYSLTQIKDELSYFEKCIYSSDFDSSNYGYESIVDESNFVNYFLLYELAYPGYYSEENFLLYKDENDKFSLCHNLLEDCGLQNDDYYHNLLASTWFSMITKSESFSSNVINEYKYLRLTSFSEESLNTELDKCANFLLTSSNVNEEKLMKQKEALNEYLLNRIKWIDNNIESIKEFSALSAVKEYKTTPY